MVVISIVGSLVGTSVDCVPEFNVSVVSNTVGTIVDIINDVLPTNRIIE